jgi:hypothetical protein
VIETLNEKPFEHHCLNGTTFKAERCDFVGGVTAFVPGALTPSQAMADAVEMGAWHWTNIVPNLNGFTGPGSYTVVSSTEIDHERRSRVLKMPLLEFFSIEHLRTFEDGSTATRTHNCIKYEQEWRQQESERSVLPPASINTVEEFLDVFPGISLLRIPNFGRKCLTLVERLLDVAGLALKPTTG